MLRRMFQLISESLTSINSEQVPVTELSTRTSTKVIFFVRSLHFLVSGECMYSNHQNHEFVH